MSTALRLLRPADLDERLAALGQGTPPLSAAHGLMTAVIIGPAELQPEHWLPYTLSADGRIPESAGREELETLALSLYGLYNDTLAFIREGQFQPWLGREDDPEARMVNLGLWCVGFSKGMQFFEEKWFSESDKGMAELLVPVFYFIQPERFIPLYLEEENDEEKRFELDLLMQSQLPESVHTIYDFWRARKEPPAA